MLQLVIINLLNNGNREMKKTIVSSDIIHVHIYDPASGNFLFKQKASERSQLHIYTCPSHKDCDAHKQGACINVGNAFGARCHAGKKSVESGFTRRAKGYYEQVRGWKESHSEKYNKLKPAPKRITRIGGGYMLPYPHINYESRAPFKSESGLFSGGCPFISSDDMTVETVSTILRHRPRAIMGGEIASYRKEVVPKIILDIKLYYPKLLSGVSDELISSIIGDYDYKGRKALLSTLKPCTVIISKDSWKWDGEKLSSTNKKFMTFEPCKWETCYSEFKPKKDTVITITSNEQVTESTVFTD